MQSSSRIQRPYWRNGPDHRSGADVSFLDIVKIFDFQRIKVGRWVTAAEQQLAANLFFDALCDLQTVLQVPTPVISLNGSLALSFGTGGSRGTCAFYQPQGRVLALAKNAGGGSLAHEWFMPSTITLRRKCLKMQCQPNLLAVCGYKTKSLPRNQCTVIR